MKEPRRATSYDLDGNMMQCGDWIYAYDDANRLKTVSSNGAVFVTNFYDVKSRRVKKETPEATTTFFYDDWNLIEERIAYTNGTSSTIRYFWGKDLSDTLQGAGGVGGLLYLTIDDSIYIPCYDNNGNITRYLDANGNVVAQYTYDALVISSPRPVLSLTCSATASRQNTMILKMGSTTTAIAFTIPPTCAGLTEIRLKKKEVRIYIRSVVIIALTNMTKTDALFSPTDR